MFNLDNLKFLAYHALDIAGVALLTDLLNQLASHPVSSDNTVIAIVGAAAAILGKAALAYLTRKEPTDL